MGPVDVAAGGLGGCVLGLLLGPALLEPPHDVDRDLVEQQHGDREAHLADHVGRGQDRGGDEDQDDGVATAIGQLVGREDADATEEAYRAKMDESRAEAMKLTGAAKQEGALATEKKLAKADKAIQDKAAKAEAKIRESRQAALANLEGVAAELTQDIASKVAGISLSKDDAAKAVKAALNG